MAIQIIVADDHALVRAGVVRLLSVLDNLKVVAEAQNGEEVLTQVASLKPDLVLMDIQMPRLNGLESLARLTKQKASTKVIMVSMYKNEEYILRALKLGAHGYLLKDAGPVELEQAIRRVMQGETYLDSRLEESVDAYRKKLDDMVDPLDKLTSRQREVLQLWVQGYSSKQMAKALAISIKTVEAHRSQIMKTLGIYDTASLVRFAIRTGLLSSEEG